MLFWGTNFDLWLHIIEKETVDLFNISDDKKRTKFAKMLEGYGVRVQKSALNEIVTASAYWH